MGEAEGDDVVDFSVVCVFSDECIEDLSLFHLFCSSSGVDAVVEDKVCDDDDDDDDECRNVCSRFMISSMAADRAYKCNQLSTSYNARPGKHQGKRQKKRQG